MSHQQSYCKVAIAPVRSEASDRSEIVTQLLFGEVVEVLEQQENWCKIQSFSDNYVGWMDPKQLRKLTKKEVSRWLDGLSYLENVSATLITPWGKQQIVKGSFLPWNLQGEFSIGNDAFVALDNLKWTNQISPLEAAEDYNNAPYLWGGKTPFGIDCSGFTQMIFRYASINLPRDASQQIDYGVDVAFEDREKGDLAFFKNREDKIIHVGILTSENEIMHASGQVRKDVFDQEGILHYSGEFHTHFLAGIKRMI